ALSGDRGVMARPATHLSTSSPAGALFTGIGPAAKFSWATSAGRPAVARPGPAAGAPPAQPGCRPPSGPSASPGPAPPAGCGPPADHGRDVAAGFRTTTSTGSDGRMLPRPSVPSTEKA